MIYVIGKSEKSVEIIVAFIKSYLKMYDLFNILGEVVKAPYNTAATDLRHTTKLFNTTYIKEENVVIRLDPQEPWGTVDYLEQEGYTLLVVHTIPRLNLTWLQRATLELMYSLNYLLQINHTDFCADSYNTMYYKKQAMIQKSKKLNQEVLKI